MNANRTLCLCCALGAGALFAAASGGLRAQTADAGLPASGDTSEGLLEIVVTAQRRAESLQEVPLSVTAINASQLASSGTTGIEGLSMEVPTLNVQNGGGYLFTHLRGVGNSTPGAGLENPIALYVDGVYYANQSVGLFSFNNIAQIDVLKGPQGTLFGRNSTGGLIQVTTAEPTQDFQLKADVGASNFRGAGGDLYVSGGIMSNLAADVAITGSRSGGYGTNLYNGQDVYAEPWNLALRSKWVYTPDDWKATLIGDYSNTDNSYSSLTAAPGSYVSRPFVPAPSLGSDPWNADVNVQPLVKQADMGGSLRIEHNLGPVMLSNQVAGRRSTLETVFDDDGTPLPIEGFQIAQRDWQFTDEVQLVSNSGGALKWVGGLYYFYDQAEYDPTTISFAGTPELNPLFPVGRILATAKQDSASVAGFAQTTYSITDSFDVTAGLRYSHEHRILNGASENGVLLVPGSPTVPIVPSIPERNTSFDDPTYRLALDYKITPDAMVYASFNTGFKSGGYNASNPTDPAFQPEKLYAYELGEKVEMFDRRLRVNSAIFYYKYNDIQVQKPEEFSLGIINGSRATLYGFDGEITAMPVKALQLSAGLSLLHTKFDSFPDAPISTPGGGLPTSTGSAAGNELSYSPKSVVDVSGTYYVIPAVSVSAVYYHSARFYFAPDNVISQPAYNKLNASTQWTADSGRYWVRLYGDNLTNAAVAGATITTPVGAILPTLQPPRVYGIKIGFKY